MRHIAIMILILTTIGCITIEPEDLEPRSAVLLEFAPESMISPCSRTGPPPIDAYWTPGEIQIDVMESYFDRLLRLKSSDCCFQGVRISSLAEHDLHYVAVVSGGRQLILIATTGDWCDGGPGAWGVVYDVATGEFSDLHMNGVA